MLQGTLTGTVEVATEASVPDPLCTDGTLRLRKGKGPARQSSHSQVVIELDVSSPAVRPSPSLLHQRGCEGRRRILHLQQVLTGHISILSAEMRGMSGPWGQFYTLASNLQAVWPSQTGAAGTPQGPWTLAEVRGTDLPPFLPSLAQPACMAERRIPMGKCGTRPSAPSDPCPASCVPVRMAVRTANG